MMKNAEDAKSTEYVSDGEAPGTRWLWYTGDTVGERQGGIS